MKEFITQQNVMASVDNGYDSTKVYAVINGKEYKFKFKSKFEKANDDLNKNNTMGLWYCDEHYLVGEGASMDNLEYDKTGNELHKICTYAALSRLSNYIGMDFNLVVGYPLNIYSANKEVFAQYLKTDGFVDVKVRYESESYEEKLFKVSECTVLPQGAGALYCEPDKWKDRLVAIIDIGGNTINGCIADNLNIVRESIFTEKLGILILQNEIKKRLDSVYGVDIQEYELPGILRDRIYRKYGVIQEKSKEIIEEILQNHVENIKKVIK
jgi:plasmid segregation protein ParM